MISQNLLIQSQPWLEKTGLSHFSLLHHPELIDFPKTGLNSVAKLKPFRNGCQLKRN
jgi:hypothetical protein